MKFCSFIYLYIYFYVHRLHAQSMVNQNIFWCVGVFLFTGYRTLWAQMNLLVWHRWAWCVGQWCAVWMTFSGACVLGRLVRVRAVCQPDRVVARVCVLEFVCGFYRPHPSSWFVFYFILLKIGSYMDDKGVCRVFHHVTGYPSGSALQSLSIMDLTRSSLFLTMLPSSSTILNSPPHYEQCRASWSFVRIEN